MELEYLIYVSKATQSLTKNDLDQILEKSRQNNLERNITGMLLFIEGRFFQVLEGRKEDIEDTYSKIARDERHKDLIIISRGTSKNRIFKEWSMRFNTVSVAEFAKISGIDRLAELIKFNKPKLENQAVMFMRKFANKSFPSATWWAN